MGTLINWEAYDVMERVEGRVNEALEAWVNVELAGNAGILSFMVDTGFAGTLMLPIECAQILALPPKGREQFVGVEGKPFLATVTQIDISWLGDEFTVPAVISEAGDALLGSDMLVDAVLTIDYARGTVKIEKE